MIKEVFFKMQEAEANGGMSITPEDVSTRLTMAEGSYEDAEKETDSPNEENQPVKETEKRTEAETKEFIPNKIWDIFKDDTEFKMPENITKENEDQLLKEYVAKKLGIKEPVLHPLAKQIQEIAEKNPDITINDLLSNTQNEFIDVNKMSIEEKIVFDLYARYGQYDEKENPNGLTEEDIDAQLKAMTKIQKNEYAREVEERIKLYNESLLKEYENKKKEEYEKTYNNIIETNKKLISELKNKLVNVNTVYGIPVSQEDHNNYIEEFTRFITPDKETGIRKIDEMLSDDMTLYKLFILAAKNGEDKILELITKGKEGTKEELFKKLGIKPSFGSSRNSNPQQIDMETARKLLTMPEMNNY